MSTARPATPLTAAANASVRDQLPFDDTTDFDNASRGLIHTRTGQITDGRGAVVWDFDRWQFLAGDAPDSVNPSLWRQGQLASMAGVYRVSDGIYQARGYDLSVATFIRGETGWIVVDPLVSEETASAALADIRAHVEDLPVVAVMYTHSHVDHYGGVRGVLEPEAIADGSARIVAPIGFLEESVSENVMAGTAMSRRASYMYGNLVGWDAHGGVGAGLGQLTSSGTIGLVPPTDIISRTGQELTLDGVRIVFQHTPGAEAPAEFCFYLPDHRALCMAEIATHTLHNVYTLRGAKIRDAKAWSRHINDAIHLFAGDADVVFSSHHWPTWGNDAILAFLKGQRDVYRYIHDETLRLANHGYNYVEIAEMIELPEGISTSFANRGYYGSLSHDAKSVYVYYLGWFDGNPATLHELPPVASATKVVEYMGGADAILSKAKEDFAAGNYRWTAQVLNWVVFADPENETARTMQADTLEQLGYQTENGTWRDFYLSGAKELRDGVAVQPTPDTASPDTVRAMTVEMLLDYLGIRLNGPDAASTRYTFGLDFSDEGSSYTLDIENGVLNWFPGQATEPTAALTLTRGVLDDIVLGRLTLDEATQTGAASIAGDAAAFTDFLGLLDDFEMWFNIVTP